MSRDNLKQVRGKRLRLFLGFFTGVLILLWVAHPYLLSWGLRKSLEIVCMSHGLTFRAEKITARFGAAVAIEKVQIRAMDDKVSATNLSAEQIKWEWTNAGSFFSDAGRFIQNLSLTNVAGIWDVRHAEIQGSQSQEKPFKDKSGILMPRSWIPLAISLTAPSIEILADGQRWALEDVTATFSETETGRLQIGAAFIQTDAFSRSFQALHALTAWKKGILWLADLEILPGLKVHSMSVDLTQPDGLRVSFLGGIFGGSLRGDLTFHSANDSPTWDVAAWASNISLDTLPSLLRIESRTTGKIKEGRFTFRGNPANPTDAEASLHLEADNFHLNNRGWESLEVSASLIHGRLAVTNFDLRQKENHIDFNGEFSLAKGWTQIVKSPFQLSVKADIKELGSLAGIFGTPLHKAAGRMSARGTVKGREGQLDGFLSMEASNIKLKSLPIDAVRLQAIFKKNELQIAHCEAYARKDTLQANGSIGLAVPHYYTGELNAHIANLAAYCDLLGIPADKVSEGLLALHWQGDGSMKAHSGAFKLRLERLTSELTPTGLTGRFSGTYSPQNLYFSTFQIEKGSLRFESQATVASSGITLKDAELRNGNSVVLDAALFFPIDIFAILHGTDWCAAINPHREMYLRTMTHSDLDLGGFLRLIGRSSPLQGVMQLNVNMGGLPSSPMTEGVLSMHHFSMAPQDMKIPETSFEAQFSSRDGVAELNANFRAKGFQPATLKAQVPFGLVKTGSDEWRWINPQGELHAILEFPQVSLMAWRPLLPKLNHLKGEISGNLMFSQTLASPRIKGRAELRNVSFDLLSEVPHFSISKASTEFAGDGAYIQDFRGEVGNAPFEILGSIHFANFDKPKWNLELHGEKIHLFKNSELPLQINLSLQATGQGTAGQISGSASIVNARINRRFEFVPTLDFSLPEELGFIQPTLAGCIPDPLAKWELNIKIESPFLLQGSSMKGEVVPSVTLIGTLEHPVPIGFIILKNMEISFPYTLSNIVEGRINFSADHPWLPILHIQSTTKISDLEIYAYAIGPLDEHKLILYSDPPLSQHALFLLLRKNIYPDLMDRLGRDIANRMENQQFDISRKEKKRIRFHLQADFQDTGHATLLNNFRLWDELDLIIDLDKSRLFNSNESYKWRMEW